MRLINLISGTLALYLFAAPCLVFGHQGVLVDNNSQGHHQSEGGVDAHSHNHESSEHEDNKEEKHCCSDLSSLNHVPIKELPTVGIFVSILSEVKIVIPKVHLANKVAFPRDGPIFEHAREFAKTTVIRV